MSRTIALFGHNGSLGRAVLRSLVARSDGQELRIYHRPTSSLTGVPSGVEKVKIDFNDENGLAESLKGVDVVVSAVGNAGKDMDITIGRAVKAAGVKVFIPSYYTCHEVDTQAEADYFKSVAGAHIAANLEVKTELEKLGIPMTLVLTGLFTNMALAFGFVLPSVIRNAAVFWKDAEKIPFPIASVEYIGAGVAEIASAPIDTIVGKTFRLVQFSPTGAEFVEALTQVNGSKPTVEHLTPGKLEQLKSSPPPGMAFLALDAYLKELWGEGRTLLRGEDWKVESFPRITLVENVQSIRANPPKMPPMPPSKG